MFSKNDILTSLVLSFGFFGISLGIIGMSHFFVNFMFLVITLIVSLSLFSVYKPFNKKVETGKGYDRPF